MALRSQALKHTHHRYPDVVPFLMENSKSANLSATRKLAADLADLRKIAEGYLKTVSDDEPEDSDSDDEDCMDVDLRYSPTHNQMPSTTVRKINFLVSRLMDLLPVTESVLEVQDFQRESTKNRSLDKEPEQHNRADPLMFEQKKQRREKLRRLKLNIQRSRNEDNGSQTEPASGYVHADYYLLHLLTPLRSPNLQTSESFPHESSIDNNRPLGNRTTALRSGLEITSPTWPDTPFSFDLPRLFSNTTRMVARTRSESCLKIDTVNERISPRLMAASSP
jgi:hypothetical protein